MRAQSREARLAEGLLTEADGFGDVAARPLVVRAPAPSQLHRRSVAALYAQHKAAADFRRVSRRLFQLAP